MSKLFNLDILKLALNRVSDAIFIMTVDGELVYANQQFCREYGVTLDEYEGEAYRFTDTMRTKESFDAKVKQLRELGGEVMYQASFKNVPDGKQHVHQVNAFLIENNGVEMVAFFMQDITSLIESRNQYRIANDLLDTILNNLPVYVFVKDVDNEFRYVYWNKAFADFAKIPAEKVIGNTDFEVFPDYNDALKFREDDIETVRSGQPINRRESYLAADGKVRIVQTLKTLQPREGQGPLLIGVSLDITDLQLIEEELIKERIHAEESDRLKSAFLANMSHEIRTPLNAIVGFSQLLLDNSNDDESRALYSDIIRQNSDVLLQLINDILDISKIEAGTLEYVREPFDLDDMLHYLYETHRGKMHDNVWLILDNKHYQQKIILNEDQNRVMQVVTNLLTNATKFTNEGEIRFGYTIKDKFIEIYVKDTGIGIAPERIDDIFKRFVKLNSFAQGTGLGLSICKLIVNMIGGDLTVESQLGKGSTFRFTIPYAEGAEIAKQMEATAVEKPKLKQLRTILVAEDVFSNYKLIEAYIGKKFRLLWAKDGEEAVKMFREEHPDLILMDLKMPRMDGYESTRRIREISSDIAIVALSAFAFESDKQKAFEAGVNDYLTKPVTDTVLVDIVNKYLK